MPFSITCPSCSAKLKTATAIPIGRSVQCPKCKESFAVSAKNMVEVEDSKFLPPNSGAAKAAAAPVKKATAAADSRINSLDDAPPRKSRRDEDEDVRPRCKRRDDEDEDDRPRGRNRRDSDDEDDRPRAKRRDQDDDDDERPRSRQRRDEVDEEEDRPRSRKRGDDDDRPSRHRDDDEVDDDRPRRRKKKKTSSLPVMIGLGLFGLIALAGIGYLIYSLIAGGGGGSYDTEMLAFLPAESTLVASVDCDELAGNAKLKEVVGNIGKMSGNDPLKEANEKLKPTGLTTDDFSRLVMGGTVDKGDPTIVLRTKKSFDRVKMAEFLECKKEEKKGDKTFYTNPNGGDAVVYFPGDTLAVKTTKKQFETLSTKDSSKMMLTEEMQDLAKKMSKGHIWVAIFKNMLPKETMDQIDFVKAARIPYLPPELIDAVKDMKGFGFWAKADGDKIKFGLGVLCTKQEVAEKAESAMQKEIDEQRNKNLEDNPIIKNNPLLQTKEMPSEVKSLTSSLQKSMAVDRSGSLIEMTGGFGLSDLEAVMKKSGIGQQRPQPQPQPKIPGTPPKRKN